MGLLATRSPALVVYFWLWQTQHNLGSPGAAGEADKGCKLLIDLAGLAGGAVKARRRLIGWRHGFKPCNWHSNGVLGELEPSELMTWLGAGLTACQVLELAGAFAIDRVRC